MESGLGFTLSNNPSVFCGAGIFQEWPRMCFTPKNRDDKQWYKLLQLNNSFYVYWKKLISICYTSYMFNIFMFRTSLFLLIPFSTLFISLFFVFSQFYYGLNIKVISVFISSLSDTLVLRKMQNSALSFLFSKYWELGWKRSKAKKRREYFRVTEAHNGTVTMVTCMLFLPPCEVNHRNEEMNFHRRAGLLCSMHENNDCGIGIRVFIVLPFIVMKLFFIQSSSQNSTNLWSITGNVHWVHIQ